MVFSSTGQRVGPSRIARPVGPVIGHPADLGCDAGRTPSGIRLEEYAPRPSRNRRTVTSVAAVFTSGELHEPRLGLSPLLVDVSVVVVLWAVLALDIGTRVVVPGQRPIDPLGYLLLGAMTLPFLVHRRWPMPALAVTLTALLGYALLSYAAFPGINAFVLVFAIALHSDRRHSLIAFVATLAALMIALAVQPPAVTVISDWISTALCTAVAWLLGENWRMRRARWAAIQERNLLLEHERADRDARAVSAERMRIARELHDSVAHSMSIIAIQAGMGHHVMDTQPEEAKRALAQIETTSRNTLAEMRRLLGVLRGEGEDAAMLTPAPGIASLPALVAHTSQAGLPTTLLVTGTLGTLSPSVELSAYRIVQESLTNAIKHGGSSAQVTVDVGATELCIDVENAGASGPEVRNPGEPPLPGSGQGLVGMRERAAVFGGRLDAGSAPGGGYRVRARLPLTADARSRGARAGVPQTGATP
jgi:signal transduction histidine kinase